MRILLLLSLVLSGCSYLKAPEKKTPFFRMAWSKNLDPGHTSGNLAIGTGAPRIFNDVLFMGSLSGNMKAYDVESGRVLWSHDEKTHLGAPVEFFKDHIAYGGLNGRLFVRHYLTGKLKYAIDLAAPVESAPVFVKDRLLVYLRGHQIVQLDAETGKIIWVYNRAVPVSTTLQRTTKPLVIGNKIIVGFADGFVGALSFQEGTILWETKIVDQGKFVDVDLNPLMVSNTVVTGSPSGELKAINPDSGAIARDYRVSVTAHPVLKGNQILLGSVDGEVILMGLDGSIIKKTKISKAPISAVAWWKDHIVASSFDGRVRAIDPLSFKVLDQFALGHDYSAIFSDLVTTDDYLAFYTSRNRLYLFQ